MSNLKSLLGNEIKHKVTRSDDTIVHHVDKIIMELYHNNYNVAQTAIVLNSSDYAALQFELKERVVYADFYDKDPNESETGILLYTPWGRAPILFDPSSTEEPRAFACIA